MSSTTQAKCSCRRRNLRTACDPISEFCPCPRLVVYDRKVAVEGVARSNSFDRVVPMAPVAHEDTLKLRLGVPPTGREPTLPQPCRAPVPGRSDAMRPFCAGRRADLRLDPSGSRQEANALAGGEGLGYFGGFLTRRDVGVLRRVRNAPAGQQPGGSHASLLGQVGGLAQQSHGFLR